VGHSEAGRRALSPVGRTTAPMCHRVIRSRRTQTVPFRTSKEETAATASTGAREGPVLLFAVVRRQSSNQELFRSHLQGGGSARHRSGEVLLCCINKASFTRGRAKGGSTSGCERSGEGVRKKGLLAPEHIACFFCKSCEKIRISLRSASSPQLGA
jgi:hypothetical protein